MNGWNNGLAWLSSGQFLARFEFAQALAAGRDRTSQARARRSSSTARRRRRTQVVDALLARLGIAARVPAGVRQALIDYFGPSATPTSPT